MNPEELKKLQEQLQKSIEDGVKALEKQVGEERAKAQQEIEGLKTQLKEVVGKLVKLESLPAGSKNAHVFGIGRSSEYKGYKLNRQGAIFRKNLNQFETLRDEEAVDEFSKFMIDLLKAVRFKDQQAMADLQKFYQEKATMVAGTDANGGFLVPDEFLMDIVGLGRDRTFALNECTVIPMSSDKMLVPAELTLASMNWKAESAQMAQGEPTFAQVQLDAKNLTGFAIVTNQLLTDTAVDIVSILSEQFGYGTALELDNQVLNGTGDPVSGVLTAAAGFSVVLSTGKTNFSSVGFDDIVDLIDKIPEGLDINLRLVFNKTIKAALRKIKDSQNNYLLHQPGGVAPGTVWEVPYINSSKGPKTTTASTVFMVCGNFRYFYIGRRAGAMTIDVDPYGRFDYNETRFRMVTRWAPKIARANAFARLITAAS